MICSHSFRYCSASSSLSSALPAFLSCGSKTALAEVRFLGGCYGSLLMRWLLLVMYFLYSGLTLLSDVSFSEGEYLLLMTGRKVDCSCRKGLCLASSYLLNSYS